ncbi:MAG TPA: glycosyltransferase family 2 protein [Candidatus Eisenbacteria bacterium]|nr:glycosyltransferase family 2 protein [Candidatus Eisenbacteria bacterium]
MERARRSLAATSDRLPSLSALVPVHDEEATIAGVAGALCDVLPWVADAWEVIVVDDGSRDRTPRIADHLAATVSGVRVVRHAANRGYGAAVRSGLAAARSEWMFLTDGDGQFDPATLRDVFPALGDADALIGFRERRADARHRRAFTTAWNTLVRAAIGVRVRDVNCAFKLVRRALLDDLDAHATGGAISAELLRHLARRGARIVEVPVPHFARRAGRASGGSPRVALRAFAELAALWWRQG